MRKLVLLAGTLIVAMAASAAPASADPTITVYDTHTGLSCGENEPYYCDLGAETLGSGAFVLGAPGRVFTGCTVSFSGGQIYEDGTFTLNDPYLTGCWEQACEIAGQQVPWIGGPVIDGETVSFEITTCLRGLPEQPYHFWVHEVALEEDISDPDPDNHSLTFTIDNPDGPVIWATWGHEAGVDIVIE